VAAVASEHGEAVRVDAALEIITELLFNVLRKRHDALTLDLFEQRFELLSDNMIEGRLVRPSRAVFRPTRARGNAKALRASFEALHTPASARGMPGYESVITRGF
jgi:hypothetical protein